MTADGCDGSRTASREVVVNRDCVRHFREFVVAGHG